MILIERDEYTVFQLRSGDLLVTRGAWLLLRYTPVRDSTLMLGIGDAPSAWYPEAERVLREAKERL